MNQASLKALAQQTLDETCQRFIYNRGVTPVTFHLARSEDEIVCVQPLFLPPETESISIYKQIAMTSEAIRRGLNDGSVSAQAVLTAGEALPRSGRKALLVTLDSPALTFMLFRYYEWRGFDVILLDTVDSTTTSQSEFIKDDAATHFYDGLRTLNADMTRDLQKQ